MVFGFTLKIVEIYLCAKWKIIPIALYLFPWKSHLWISVNSECFIISTDPLRIVYKWVKWSNLPFIWQEHVRCSVTDGLERIKSGGKEPLAETVTVNLVSHYWAAGKYKKGDLVDIWEGEWTRLNLDMRNAKEERV